jgi:hypothetical protein
MNLTATTTAQFARLPGSGEHRVTNAGDDPIYLLYDPTPGELATFAGTAASLLASCDRRVAAGAIAGIPAGVANVGVVCATGTGPCGVVLGAGPAPELASWIDDLPFISDSGVIRQKNNYTDDFVVGSPQLDDDGNSAHDNRMWFDKSKGAFRAGGATGSEWNDANVGDHSAAFGNIGTASGSISTHFGVGGVASGTRSTHFGGGGTANSAYSAHFGLYGVASVYAQTVFAAGQNEVDGDAQVSLIPHRAEIDHPDTAWHTIYIDGIDDVRTVQTDSSNCVICMISGTTSGATKTFAYLIYAHVENDGGTVAIKSQTKLLDSDADDASFDAQLAVSGTAVVPQVKDADGTGDTVRWSVAFFDTEAVYAA